MSRRNLCLAIVYVFAVGVFLSSIIFKDLLKTFPSLEQLKERVSRIKQQSKINLILPSNIQNKHSKILNQKLNNKLNIIFKTNSQKSQYFCDICNNQFTIQKKLCLKSHQFQNNLLSLQQLVESPLVFGTYQYIQILTLNNQNYEQQILKLFNKLRIHQSSFHLSKRSLLWQQIDENFRDSQSNNLNQLIHKIDNLRYLSNCQYTHISCEQTTFILSKFASQNIQQINNIYYLNPKQSGVIQKLLLIKFNFDNFKSKSNIKLDLWYRIQLLKLLNGIEEDIQYLENIKSNRFSYILEAQEINQIQKWIKNSLKVVQLLSNKQYQQGWRQMKQRTALKHNSQIGKLNLFASDYKLGLYLPLIVSFAYPIILFIKSILWITYKRIKQKKIKEQ